MARAVAILFGLGVLLSLAGPAAGGERLVHLVNIGWHTGIAVRSADIDPALIPEIGDLPEAGWVEFGWGDAAFYRDPDPAIGSYVSAAFIETPAVMHLVGMPVPPARYFPDAEVVDVPLDTAGFDRLIGFIAASFDRAQGERLSALGPGLYRRSGFYDAVGTFTLSNTCNTWVARAFAAAGLEIDTDLSRASTVTARVRAAVAAR
ncbi:DUF2459 domain-containing protein [Thalassobaculum salexigens]|uniref:DUF2459 domain-containing protein n=1 Tax=Thalassobaculum salexigens TaxID=455360 RepID=UPI0003FAE842|nr:DUF2459 domain-containing protein [Thalassobaculum salexigens]